jgi:RNA polymerase sigma-70 factor, ECF subfamily
VTSAVETFDFEAALLPILGQAYGYALRLTRNQADAEDLVQDATLHALRGLHTFQPGSLFKPWFFRILTNCHRMRWRTRARRVFTVSFEDAPELYLYAATGAASVAVDCDPAAALISRLSHESIQHAIRQLPVDYQEAAALYYSDELPYQEIAEVLDVPIGTVRSRLHRARKLLQKLLWREAIDAGVAQAPLRVTVPARGLDRAACEVAFTRLDDYLDRELNTMEMDLVRAHLEVCALCTSEFAFEANLIDSVRNKLRRIDVPNSVRTRLSRRLRVSSGDDHHHPPHH